MHGICCKHTTLDHFFEQPLCKDRMLLKRIGTIVFHILTLGIPFVIYKAFTACYMKRSESDISIIDSSKNQITSGSTIRFPYSERLMNLLLTVDNSLKVLLSADQLGLGENDTASYKEIEKFTHSDYFKQLPPIVKIRLNWHGCGLQEIILIKYTLFVPEEADRESNQVSSNKEAIEGGNDSVWHDYLLIKYDPGLKIWTVNDPRCADHLPHDSREKAGYPTFPYTPYPPVFYDLKDKSLETFLTNQAVGLFRNAMSLIPPYIKNHTNNFSNQQRVFKDIPVKLGHISLEEVHSLLKFEDNPDVVGMKNQPGSLKKIISF